MIYLTLILALLFNGCYTFPSLPQIDFSIKSEVHGVTIEAPNAIGKSFATGDFNGDGIQDLVVGAPEESNLSREKCGVTYLVLGYSNLKNITNLTEISANDTTILKITGANNNDSIGSAVTNAGDINGDGIDDILLGVPNATLNSTTSGLIYVLFGKKDGLSHIDLAKLETSQGFIITSKPESVKLGQSVAGLGDINNDSISDFAFTDSEGTVYVIYGKKDLSKIDLTNSLEESKGATIKIPSTNSTVVVRRAGDLNGDKISDLMILKGAEIYVLYGKASKISNMDLKDGVSSGNGFIITVDVEAKSISAAGDVNGDGLEDILIGVPGATYASKKEVGIVYVVYGKKDQSNIKFSESFTKEQGFKIGGVNNDEKIGLFVSAAGDLNKDGFADVMVSGLNSVYVIYGKKDGLSEVTADSSLPTAQGFNVSQTAKEKNAITGLASSGTQLNIIIGSGNRIFIVDTNLTVTPVESKTTTPKTETTSAPEPASANAKGTETATSSKSADNTPISKEKLEQIKNKGKTPLTDAKADNTNKPALPEDSATKSGNLPKDDSKKESVEKKDSSSGKETTPTETTDKEKALVESPSTTTTPIDDSKPSKETSTEKSPKTPEALVSSKDTPSADSTAKKDDTKAETAEKKETPTPTETKDKEKAKIVPESTTQPATNETTSKPPSNETSVPSESPKNTNKSESTTKDESKPKVVTQSTEAPSANATKTDDPKAKENVKKDDSTICVPIEPCSDSEPKAGSSAEKKEEEIADRIKRQVDVVEIITQCLIGFVLFGICIGIGLYYKSQEANNPKKKFPGTSHRIPSRISV